MSNDINPHALELLHSFLQQQKITATPEEVGLKSLTGGRSGAGIYQFTLNNQKYVLRLFADMDEMTGRKRETLVTEKIGQHGFAPKVYYVDPNYRGMIISFEKGKTITPTVIKKPGNLEKFANFLRQVHQLSIEVPTADGYFKRAEEWHSKAKQDSYPSGMDDMLDSLAIIKQVIAKHPVAKQVIHGDLISRNILFDGNDFILVDWPAAGMGDPYWDFIDFADFLNLTDAEIKEFLQYYYQRPITQQEWDRFVVMRPVTSLVRTIGGFAFMPEIQEKAFYDQKLAEGNLPSFEKIIDDFAEDKFDPELWQILLIFYKETQQQLNSDEFKQALQRLDS